MSIDAFTGRNPSYCFVDLQTEEDAKLAMQSMQGQLIRGRPVKINDSTERDLKSHLEPGKVYSVGRRMTEVPAPKSAKGTAVLKRLNDHRYSTDARPHWTIPALENRRLYVGGLPQIPTQYALNAEMTVLFENFDVQAVSKLSWPQSSKQVEKTGFDFYAFVDLATSEEAADAVGQLNGKPTPYGGAYRISFAKRNRGSDFVYRNQLDDTTHFAEARVFVGGPSELQTVDGNIRTIFAGHAGIRSVGRLIAQSTAKLSGQHCFYCFVDFGSADEARAVVAAFRDNEIGLIVDFARESRIAGRGDDGKRERSPAEKVRRSLSRSWRRQDVSVSDSA